MRRRHHVKLSIVDRFRRCKTESPPVLKETGNLWAIEGLSYLDGKHHALIHLLELPAIFTTRAEARHFLQLNRQLLGGYGGTQPLYKSFRVQIYRRDRK